MPARFSWWGLPEQMEAWLYQNVGNGGKLLRLGYPELSEEWWDGDRWKLVQRSNGFWELVFRDREDEVLWSMTWD